MSGYVEGAALKAPGERPASLIAKPFTPDELTKKVREVLDESADRHPGSARCQSTRPAKSAVIAGVIK